MPPACTIRRRPRPLRAFSAPRAGERRRQRERDAAERACGCRRAGAGRCRRSCATGRPCSASRRRPSGSSRSSCAPRPCAAVAVTSRVWTSPSANAFGATDAVQRPRPPEVRSARPSSWSFTERILRAGRGEREPERGVGRDRAVGLHPQADRADARHVQAPEAEAGHDLAALGVREQPAVDDAQVVRRRAASSDGAGGRAPGSAARARGCGLPVTTAVAGDVAVRCRRGPVAVTTTRIVEPTSAGDEVVRRAGRAGDVHAVGARRRRSAATGA